MRKLLIFLFAASLFVACNNDKKNDRRSSRDRESERDDYRSRDDDRKDDSRNTDYKDDRDTRDKEDTRKTSDDGGGWTRSDEDKFIDDCVAEAEKNVSRSRASEYCDCMLVKLKRLYSTYRQAEKELENITQDELTELAADCNR